ncbi:signal peptidase I [Nesterenkonia massiliensis]|uniref:signal peptidase I n=1 Tax=Nesterenkonia massiliensis TaxID=1232429 RepID=UPI00041B1E70|nr:signal peptidase I [Nesterenkonia massiliensis]
MSSEQPRPDNGDLTDPAEPAPPMPEEAETRPRRRKRSPLGAFIIELITIVALAILISFLVKTFLLRAFYIPSESMQPTLEVDDRVVVNLLAPGIMEIERGDVVVFEDTRSWWGSGGSTESNPVQDALIFIGLLPDTSAHYVVKRVVGAEGDTVECCDESGRILVNGEPVDEPYLYPGNAPSDTPFEITVPEGHVWLLGDHREASADSRAHVTEPNSGAVPVEDIIGRTAGIIWPLDRMSGGGSDRDPFENVPDPVQ